jgi:hypothetical protein
MVRQRLSYKVLAREIVVLVEVHTGQLSVCEYEGNAVGTDVCLHDV